MSYIASTHDTIAVLQSHGWDRPTDAIVDVKRRAGVGAAWSESESSTLLSSWTRRVERGERRCCGDAGEDGGESARLFAKLRGRFAEAVGVTSRLVRGIDDDDSG